MNNSVLDLARASSILADNPVGHSIEHYQSVASTMPLAHAACRSSVPSGMVILADQQTQGRGRLNRHWETPLGKALLMSVILGPSLLQASVAYISILAAVSARRAIINMAPSLADKIVFKWPNDVMGCTDTRSNSRVKKVAGILTETAFTGSTLRYAVLGIGININQIQDDFPQLQNSFQPTSLCLLAGHPLDRTELLIQFCQTLGELSAAPSQALLQEWRDNLYTLGKTVTVTETAFERRDKESTVAPSETTPHPSFTGIAVDVTDDGHLVVENTQGERRTFSGGEVTLRSGLNVADDV